MKVEIYTETNVRGMQIRNGKYAAIIVFQTKKGPATKLVIGQEEMTTFHRASLLAVLRGIDELTRACEVKVHTPDAMLVNMIREGNLEKWKREEWRRPQNKELKNKELWEQLSENMEKHEVTFVYTEDSEYSAEMKKRMEG